MFLTLVTSLLLFKYLIIIQKLLEILNYADIFFYIVKNIIIN